MAWLSSHINLKIKTKHQEETVKKKQQLKKTQKISLNGDHQEK